MSNEAALFHQRPGAIPGKLVPTPVGSMNFNVLRSVLEEGGILRLQRGAEIGVFRADTSVHLLKAFPELHLVCVDPFIEYTEHEHDKSQAVMSECERTARARLEPFCGRVTLIKDCSVPAAAPQPNESLDFVFIDAIHSFEAVLSDLEAWFPKVRRGGLVAGHDVSWGGVREAVEQFLGAHNLAGFFTPSTSDVWFFLKQ